MKNLRYLAAILLTSMSITGCSLASAAPAASVWQSIPEDNSSTEASAEEVSSDKALSGNETVSKDEIIPENEVVSGTASEVSDPEPITESAPQETAGGYTVTENETDLYTQYGAYYYSIPDESSSVSGVLYKGTQVHVLGAVDSYKGTATAWKGRTQKWYQIKVGDGLFFVPSEYLDSKNPYNDSSNETVAPAENASVSETAPTEPEATVQPVQEAAASAQTPAPIDYTVYVDQVATSVETDVQKRYRALSAQYDTTGSVGSLVSADDVLEFNSYYSANYELDQQNQICNHGYTYIENDDGTYTSMLGDMPQHSRESVITLAINKFGIKTESDPYQTIYNTCARVRNKLKFNYSYTDSTCTDAFNAGQGVCVHYSVAAYVLLNAEGIPTRMLSGYRGSSCHAWNECYINGKWIPVDFCVFANGSISPNGVISSSYVGTYREANLFR